jgi:hypothetical protein
MAFHANISMMSPDNSLCYVQANAHAGKRLNIRVVDPEKTVKNLLL